MPRINNLQEIDYSNAGQISFLGTVISVISDGDGDKKPLKVLVKLESSGEQVQLCSWSFDLLTALKELVSTDDVYEFFGQPALYKGEEEQIRLKSIQNAFMKSTRKVVKLVDINKIKNEINVIIGQYLPKSSPLYTLVNNLVVNNEKFWKWPAATRVHHAYPGGLAKHSLNVCQNAINTWKTYEGTNMQIDVIVAGALLHDIGKIAEYTESGSRTSYGNLIPHICAGYETVLKECFKIGVDPETNPTIVMLNHIILSHHEKMEFGSPVQPSTMEAFIVARADALDAAVEGADKALDMMSVGDKSDKLLALNGISLFKWHN